MTNAAPSGFGKHYSSMYCGSLVGSGPLAFALMGYVISNQRPIEQLMGVDMRKVGEDGALAVELNPKLLAVIIGETTEEEIRAQIEKMCQPDPDSRSETQGGRRLVRVGQFAYWVVNGRKYRDARKLEERREQNRLAQRKHRGRKRSAEPAYLKGEKNGDQRAMDDALDPP